MADDGPRRLPPQPTAVQVSIPQPVVPEVTLLWEGEESVYWKPTTPGSKATSSQLHHLAHSRQPHANILPRAVQTNTVSATVSQPSTTSKTATSGSPTTAEYYAGYINHPERGIPVNKNIGQFKSAFSQPTAGVSLPSNEGERSADFQPPAASLHKPCTALQHPSTASITESSPKYTVTQTSSVSQLSNAIGQHNLGLPKNVACPTISSIPVTDMLTGRQYIERQCQPSNVPTQHNLGSHAGNAATFSLKAAQVNSNSTVASGVLHSNKAAVPNFQPQVYDKYSNSADLRPVGHGHRQGFVHDAVTKPHHDYNFKNAAPYEAKISLPEVRHGLTSEHLRAQQPWGEAAQIALRSESQHVAYNPLMYSSEKKPLQEVNTNWYRDSERTPVAAREARAIVPRAVDFDSATPVNRVENKENYSPEHPYKRTPDYVRQEQSYNSDKQITPYQGLSSLSPMVVNTPDPFLQKIIEGKDQQIFQLHKVLETILSKSDSKDRTSSQSSFSASPRPIVYREASTQTTEHCQNREVSRDVGINTELSWPELLDSLNKNRCTNGERCVRDVSGPSTILKNSSSVKSVVMQKSSNTSSVRFDTDSDRVIDSNYALTTREQVQNQAIRYNESSPAFTTTHLGRESRHSGASQPRGTSRAHSRETQNHVARNADERDDMGEPGHFPADRCSQRGKNGGVLSGNNHREVSLTLREVVLTTIEEDPGSPQGSLHLDLSDYPGDTILPQNHRIQATSARRSGDSSPPEVKDQGLVPARAHRNPAVPPRCQNDRSHRPRPGTPAAPRHRPTESGSKTGVTIYRNVMNNIEQLLETDKYREDEHEQPNGRRDNRADGRDDVYFPNLEQQLQQFGLSFLEPRALHSRNMHKRNSPRHGVGAVLPLYRANTTGPPPSAELNAHATSPREFSVATEEFLRKNGLMES